MSSFAINALRTHSRPAHDRVDAAYGAFDLSDRAHYAAFLRAHARALPAAEAVLAGDTSLPAWRRRTDLLAADLAALGEPMPAPLELLLPGGHAGRMGLLYVTEGSRLGGIMLARGVGPDLPSAYLAARHLPGEWRDLLARLDAAADAGGPAWIRDAQAGADAGFSLYVRALD